MSIDPQRLRAASQIILGSSFSQEKCGKLANILGITEEILPWLVLRQGAFKTFPDFGRSLEKAAERCATPLSKRTPTHASSRETLTLHKSLDDCLAVIVSENIKDERLSYNFELNLSTIMQTQPFNETESVNVRAVSYK